MDFEEMGTFCKYFSDDGKIINSLFKDKKIRFTQPSALNDPLEFRPILKFSNDNDNYRYKLDDILLLSKKDFYWVQIILYRIEHFSVLSLTKVPDSFDMWSQYSNGHKGFLIEFKHDFNKFPGMLSKEGHEYPIKKVNYVDDYSINVDEFINQDGTVHNGIDEKLFFNKVSRWKDEEEYRIVRPLSDLSNYKVLPNKPGIADNEGLYLFDLSLDCIESVTFGACMSLENKKEIMEHCRGNVKNFFQAIIVRDEKDKYGSQCNVRIVPIENFPDFMNMTNFITDVRENQFIKQRIDIRTLAELPYYKIDPNWVDQFYKNRTNRLDNKSSD